MGAMADAFAAYAQPLIEMTDGSIEQMNKAFSISQICYNLALLPADKRDEMLREVRPSLQMDEQEFDEFRSSILLPMIQRHEEMFPFLHRRGSDASSSWLIDPSPQTHRSVTRPVESSNPIDRYAPCPCGSGKKYKFCCGKKGR